MTIRAGPDGECELNEKPFECGTQREKYRCVRVCEDYEVLGCCWVHVWYVWQRCVASVSGGWK